jgi:hypothetical protein
MGKGFKPIACLEDLINLKLLTFKVFGEGSYLGDEEIIY